MFIESGESKYLNLYLFYKWTNKGHAREDSNTGCLIVESYILFFLFTYSRLMESFSRISGGFIKLRTHGQGRESEQRQTRWRDQQWPSWWQHGPTQTATRHPPACRFHQPKLTNQLRALQSTCSRGRRWCGRMRTSMSLASSALSLPSLLLSRLVEAEASLNIFNKAKPVKLNDSKYKQTMLRTKQEPKQ